MKHYGKRLLALLLVFALSAGMVGTAWAATAETEATYDDFALSGSGSLGGMLAAELGDDAEMGSQESDYNVTELTVDGSTATVTYQVSEGASLIVAIYDETTGQMLATGMADVDNTTETAIVPITGNMPEYFVAKAFLLDRDTFASLGREYQTEMYTAGMQTLLRQTIDDFDPDLVLNLDNDRTTNFGVYNEDTIQVENSRAVVTDNGNGTYTVTNADAAITSLEPGDKLSYTDAEGTLWLLKVTRISVRGKTVTITEDTDATLDDFFDTLKIEVTEQDAEVTVEGYQDPDEAMEATLRGNRAAQYAVSALSGDEPEKSFSLKFSTPKDGDIVISGTFSLTLAIKYYDSPELGDPVVETKLTTKIEGESKWKTGKSDNVGDHTSVGKKLSTDQDVKVADLLQLKFFGGVVTVGLEPKVNFKAEGGLDLKFTWTSTVGFRRVGDGAAESLSTKPQFNTEFKGEATVSLTGGMSLYVTIIDKKLMKLSLDGSVTGEAKGTLSLVDDKKAKDSQHECKVCIEGEITVKGEVSLEASAFGGKVSSKYTLLKVSQKVTDFYYSEDYNEFGWTTCPHIKYRVDFLIVDSQNEALSGAQISGLEDKTLTLTSDKNGQAQTYMRNGTYTVKASDEKHEGSKTVTVKDKAVSETITAANLFSAVTLTVTDKDGKKLSGMTIGGTGLDTAPVTNGSGVAEFELKNGTYTLTASNGTYSGQAMLLLRGQPVRQTIVANGDAQAVTVTVVDEDGKGLPNMTIGGTGLDEAPVTGMDGVARFQLSRGSYSLTASNSEYRGTGSVVIDNKPVSTTIVAKKQVSYDVTVTVVDGDGKGLSGLSIGGTGLASAPVTGADGSASFQLPAGKYQLTVTNGNFTASKTLIVADVSVELEIVLAPGEFYYSFDAEEGKLTIWGSGPMPEWNDKEYPVTGYEENYKYRPWQRIRDQIKTVEIMEGITSVGSYAFYECSNLSSVELPDGLTSIGGYAFWGCNSLGGIELPDGLTSIGGYAFQGCRSLSGIELPDGLTLMGAGAFGGCFALSRIELPDSLTTISDYVFQDCVSLSNIELPDNLTSIGKYAFEGSGLTSIVIPANVTYIDYGAFAHSELSVFRFLGSAPTFKWTPDAIYNSDYEVFQGLTATVYYPGRDATWPNCIDGLQAGRRIGSYNLTFIPY